GGRAAATRHDRGDLQFGIADVRDDEVVEWQVDGPDPAEIEDHFGKADLWPDGFGCRGRILPQNKTGYRKQGHREGCAENPRFHNGPHATTGPANCTGTIEAGVCRKRGSVSVLVETKDDLSLGGYFPGENAAVTPRAWRSGFVDGDQEADHGLAIRCVAQRIDTGGACAAVDHVVQHCVECFRAPIMQVGRTCKHGT